MAGTGAGDDEALRIELRQPSTQPVFGSAPIMAKIADTGFVVSAPLCRFRQTTVESADSLLEANDLEWYAG